MVNKIDIEVGVKGAQVAAQEIDSVGKAAERMGGAIARHGKDASGGLKAVDEVAKQLKLNLQDAAERAGPLGAILSALGSAGLVAATALVAVAAAATKMVEGAEQSDLAGRKILAVLVATGNAAGLTVQQVDEMTKALARSSLATEEEAKQAAIQLIALRSVAGESLGKTMVLAQDLASSGFGTLSSSAVALGKALADPAAGMENLQRAGVKLSESEKQHIKTLQDEGRLLDAKAALLEVVQNRVGGLGAAAAGGLTGGMHKLREATSGFFETLGQNSGVLPLLSEGLQHLQQAVTSATQAMSPESRLAGMQARSDSATWDMDKRYWAEKIAALKEQIRLAGAEQAAQVSSAKINAAAAAEADANAAQAQSDAELLQTQMLDMFEARDKGNADAEKADKETERRQKALFDLRLKFINEEWQTFKANIDREQEAEQKSVEERARLIERFHHEQRQREEEQQRDFQAYYRQNIALLEDILFNGADQGWAKTLDSMLARFKRWMTAVAFEAGSRDILVRVMQVTYGPGGGVNGGSMFSGTGLFGDMGAVGSTINNFGADYLGLANVGSGFVGPLMPGQTAGATLSGSLGAAGIGYFGGSLLGGALGLDKTGSGIGGGIGAGAAFALSGGNPLVAAGVAVLTSILGGLLAGKPSDRLEGNSLNFITGKITPGDLGPNKDSPENRAAADALANAIVQFTTVLRGVGLNPNVGAGLIEVGDRGSPFRVAVDGSGRQNFDNPQDAFKWMAQQILGSLQNVPERFKNIMDTIDWSNLDQFTKDLQDVAAWQATLAGIRDQIRQAEDPMGYELDRLDKMFAPLREEAEKQGEGLADIEKRYGQMRAEILKKYAQEQTTVVETVLAPVANWMQTVQSLYDERVASLQDEARALQDAATGWDRVRTSLSAARSGLLLDPNLSPLSLEQRRAEGLAQLKDAYGRAQGGDLAAAEQLPDLARAVLQASKDFYHSSSDYASDFNDVQDMLASTQSFAARQLTVQQLQLSALQGILAAVQGEKAALGGTPAGFNRADAEQLTALYGQARGSMSDADFLHGASGGTWIAARDRLIAGLSDPAVLFESLTTARAQKLQPGLGDVGAGYEAGVVSRLRQLGYDVPAYEAGGWVNRTGLAYVHKGEHITPAGGGDLAARIAQLEARTADHIAVTAEGFTRVVDCLREANKYHERTADAPFVTATLAATASRYRWLGPVP